MGVRAAALALLAFASVAVAQAPEGRFEKDVRAYEAMDALAPALHDAILLAGDSQFYRWKTFRDDLAGYTVVNRGVDSFQLSDLLQYTDRLVLPYHPRLIVLHVGGNDVHNGKTPERVLADFKAFVAKVHAVLPDVPIAFTSITPSPGRWDEAEVRKRANASVREYVATQKELRYIDLWDAMLTADGKPREDIWVADRVHPNHEGYLIRVRAMRSVFGAPDSSSR
jgi:lysophospholipase L1-like esterase